VTDYDAAGPVRRKGDDRQGQAGEAEASAHRPSAQNAAPDRVIVVDLGELFRKIGLLVRKVGDLLRKIGLLVRGAEGDERGAGTGVRLAIICSVIGHGRPP
jgi:hypothetical protein